MDSKSTFVIGTDTGGTFTDVTVLTDQGEIFMDKAPTTPHDFSIGVMNAVDKVSEGMGLTREELLRRSVMVKHGSTVATNALITREGSKVGLITTRGFEDTTLIMRAIGRVAGLSEEEIKHQATAVKPEPMVARELIKGVTERVDSQGKVVIPVNEDEIREALRSLVEEHRVQGIAVNLLFGFLNPEHERAVRRLFEEMYPGSDITLTCSHEICRTIREYSRSNTVIMNEFLARAVHNYVSRLGRQLAESGYQRPLLIMQANGGVVHPDEMVPVGTISSGPSGGVIASKFVADILGHKNVVTTDMGGTSFDASLLIDGHWRLMLDSIVERFHVSWPMMDIQSIGAGGGTISTVDPVTGQLRVGPKSAGAAPGPVCYGAGGVHPTITDADLILGLLDPNYFLGGRMKLNKALAEKAMREKIAEPLGMDVVEAAAGIYEIINASMSDLIRKQVVTTGRIPAEFVIYSFGGAGPVHAAAYSAELGAAKCYIFSMSAVFSAFGVAAADIIMSHPETFRQRLPVDPEVLNRKIESIEIELQAAIERQGIRREDISFRRTFYMRYGKQLNDLEVQVPTKRYTEEDIQAIMALFERKYEDVYGHGSGYREAGILLISFNIEAIGATIKPRLARVPSNGSRSPEGAVKGKRLVYFPKVGDFVDTKVYDYLKLRVGHELEGPAIVETPITTIIIPPKATAVVDPYLNIEMII